jgi:hypothetical protein
MIRKEVAFLMAAMKKGRKMGKKVLRTFLSALLKIVLSFMLFNQHMPPPLFALLHDNNGTHTVAQDIVNAQSLYMLHLCDYQPTRRDVYLFILWLLILQLSFH